MPINDPINNRKVAPGSLAFERRRLSPFGQAYAIDDPDGDVYNYQYYMDINYRITINNFVTNQTYYTNQAQTTKAIADSEHRSKHYVGDYKRSFLWEMRNAIDYNMDDWNTIPYSTEIIKAMGTMATGSYGNSPDWKYVCPTDGEGTWWVYAYHQIRYSQQKQVIETRLAVFINGTQYKTIDMVDNNMMGENHIRDCRLQGGIHVPLVAGDVLQIKFKPIQGQAPDTGTSLFPTSLYSYVSAHRENCYENVSLNSPDNGNNYSFDHSTP